jgi:Tfp pilus assembly PilM family ATPase
MLIAERLSETNEQAEQIKLTEPDSPLVHPIIEDYNTHLMTEVQKNIDMFFSGSPDRHLRKIFYCGGGVKTPGLVEMLSAIYPEQTEHLNPTKNLHFPKTGTNKYLIEDLSCLGTVAVGLALRQPGDQS